MTTKFLGNPGDDFNPYCEGLLTHLEQYDSLPEDSLFRIAGSEKVYQKQGEFCVEMFRIDGSWQPIGTMETYEGINPMGEDLEMYTHHEDTEEPSPVESDILCDNYRSLYQRLMDSYSNN